MSAAAPRPIPPAAAPRPIPPAAAPRPIPHVEFVAACERCAKNVRLAEARANDGLCTACRTDDDRTRARLEALHADRWMIAVVVLIVVAMLLAGTGLWLELRP